MKTTISRSPKRPAPVAYQLRVRLAGIEPPVWRRLLVQATMTLHELHRAIQLTFDWYDYHLYDFEVGDRRFEAPDPEAEGEDSRKVKLSQLGLEPGASFTYRYDFGDDWEHIVEVEPLSYPFDPDWLPTVVAGERAAPPEDCGGAHAYMELLELHGNQHGARPLDEDQAERIAWVGKDYDPEAFDLRQAAHALLLCSAWGVLKRL
jgi:hypothetical protein